jgi:hypothetical protein
MEGKGGAYGCPFERLQNEGKVNTSLIREDHLWIKDHSQGRV